MREFAPLRRTGQPEDIAVACLGLMAAAYTTGVVMIADGGLSLRA